MRKSIPKEFLEQYEAKRVFFDEALERITSLLKLRLSQLAARKGVRGRITDARVKRPARVWKKSKKAELSVSEVFTHIDDLLGIRIVCNNISDIDPLIEMIRTEVSILRVLDIKDMILSPSEAGYRATHIRTVLDNLYESERVPIPCEIQIRTLAQDAWARLSRADLYGKDVPPSIQKLSQALSTQLSAIDEIAQLIRDELNQCPRVADNIEDSDYISPQRLALLYKHKFGEEVYEWTLIDWVQILEEAEVEKIGDVRALLDDMDVKKGLDKLAIRIRGFPLEDAEWAVFSALVASEVSTAKGIKAVRKRIQDGWDEIVSTARAEALSEMPDTLDEFIQMLQSGHVPTEALSELGGIQSCYRCGADILRPEQAAEVVLEYYENPDLDVDLERLFGDMPDVESVDYSGACQYCGDQMSKDD